MRRVLLILWVLYPLLFSLGTMSAHARLFFGAAALTGVAAALGSMLLSPMVLSGRTIRDSALCVLLLTVPVVASLTANVSRASPDNLLAAGALLATIATAAAIGLAQDERDHFNYLRAISFTLFLTNVAVLMFGVRQAHGRLAGFTDLASPNFVGLLAVTSGSLAFAFSPIWVGIIQLVSIAICIGSSSRSSLAALCMAIVTNFALLLIYRPASRTMRPTAVMLLLLAATGVAVYGATHLGSLGDWIASKVTLSGDRYRGASSGFSGRTAIWREMIHAWRQSPILGQGFAIFRTEANAATDGGYLRVMAETGVVGLLAAVSILGFVWVRSVSCLKWGSDRLSRSQLSFIASFITLNVFESRLQSGANPASIVLYVTCFFLCAHPARFRFADGDDEYLDEESPEIDPGHPEDEAAIAAGSYSA